MNSIIIRIAAKYIPPLLIVFSLYVLLKGHNSPGGGFIGGLIAGSGVIFYSLSHNVKETYEKVYLKPVSYLMLGFFLMIVSAIAGLFGNKAVLTGIWSEINLAGVQIKLGTPLLFDSGIYLIIFGGMLMITQSILEETEWK